MSLTLDRRLFLGSAAALVGTGSVPSFAKKKAKISKNWPTIQAMLDDQVVTKRYVPGGGAAVARGAGAPEFFVSGTISTKSKTLITPDTLFRAYSMTKPITGMAAMMLIEDGKLKLDQNIADFLPGFANPTVLTEPDKSLASKPASRPITVRHLLTHTAGLGYSIVTKGPLLQEYARLGLNPAQVSRRKLPGMEFNVPTPPLSEFADRLATLPLMYDPGAKWSYSLSLDLLARVIEVASGLTFEEFLLKRLFKPLGMKSSFWQVPESEKPRMTANHADTPFGTMEVDGADDSIYFDKPAFAFGGAGLVTSMRDYDRFLAMLMGMGKLGPIRIMKPETAKLGMSNLVPEGAVMDGLVKGQGFGAGGRVTIADDPQGSGIGTFGWAGAASTIGWVDPTRGIRASGWTQIMAANQPFTTAFGKAVYGKK